MGWGKMLLLGNVGQQMDIEEMRSYLSRAIDEINEGERVDENQNREIERLRRDQRELQLYVLTLGRLLIRKGIVAEAELSDIVSAVEQAAAKR